jgi:nucleoside 2-deoxyribosyltransferase
MQPRSYLNPSTVELNPVFRGRDFRVDPRSCFVLMPFKEPWSERIWRHHIKPTVESLDLSCKRADDILSTNVIIEDIWEAINQSNIIIADLTGKNPNVFYELGIAHVVGVPTILLSQDNEIQTFDTAQWRQIRYEDNSVGCELLEKLLKETIITMQNKKRYQLNNAKVNQTETICGTIKELPSGKVIWVFVFSKEVRRYYPQNQPADIEAGNNWSSIVYIGIPSDIGKKFEIIVVSANSEAQGAINNYLVESKDQNDWPGLTSIPEGAVIIERNTVTRK